ncbi:hypothetical protein [Amycolatopsis nigrescens]|uniref:hypothetical protein n=1 Tax=Amycolatopsis nigrescens TaxID=381445 RepID=UPI00036715D8|nr:hypothetical protein [Amycolatopsis nigrescens]
MNEEKATLAQVGAAVAGAEAHGFTFDVRQGVEGTVMYLGKRDGRAWIDRLILDPVLTELSVAIRMSKASRLMRSPRSGELVEKPPELFSSGSLLKVVYEVLGTWPVLDTGLSTKDKPVEGPES